MSHCRQQFKNPFFIVITLLWLSACGGGNGNGTVNTGGSPASDSAVLSWDGPTTNADVTGTKLNDLAGYRVYMSTMPGGYTASDMIADVPAANSYGGGTESYTATSLSPGTYYFVVTAYDASGNESGYTQPEVSKTII